MSALDGVIRIPQTSLHPALPMVQMQATRLGAPQSIGSAHRRLPSEPPLPAVLLCLTLRTLGLRTALGEGLQRSPDVGLRQHGGHMSTHSDGMWRRVARDFKSGDNLEVYVGILVTAALLVAGIFEQASPTWIANATLATLTLLLLNILRSNHALHEVRDLAIYARHPDSVLRAHEEHIPAHQRLRAARQLVVIGHHHKGFLSHNSGALHEALRNEVKMTFVLAPFNSGVPNETIQDSALELKRYSSRYPGQVATRFSALPSPYTIYATDIESASGFITFQPIAISDDHDNRPHIDIRAQDGSRWYDHFKREIDNVLSGSTESPHAGKLIRHVDSGYGSNSKVAEYIRSASDRLDFLVYRNLQLETMEVLGLLKDACSNSVRVQLLALSSSASDEILKDCAQVIPASKHLDAGTLRSQIANAETRIAETVSGWPQGAQRLFSYRAYVQPPRLHFYRVDTALHLGFYGARTNAGPEDRPYIEFPTDSALGSMATDHFDAVWRDEGTIEML